MRGVWSLLLRAAAARTHVPCVQFGNGALSPFIPLWFGGEEYNEDPVVDLPSLQQVRPIPRALSLIEH